jgi:magnesium chelatase subunit D
MEGGAAAWEDALLAARLFAADPHRIAGIRVNARAGPVRDRWLGHLQSMLDARTVRKLPPNIGADRLLGGLDLPATLSAGRPVVLPGLLAEANGGVVIIPMAERMAPHVAVALASALDDGEIAVERDGLTLRSAARIGIVLLDEGADTDEAPPAAIIERLGLVCNLDGISNAEAYLPDAPKACPDGAQTTPGDGPISTLCQIALAMGIDSARASILALSVARAAAFLDRRATLSEDDLACAARLSLLPRARRLPRIDDENDEDPDPTPNADDQSNDALDAESDIGQLAHRIVDAVRATLPPDVLAGLERAAAQGRGTQTGRGSAGLRKSLTRGRPVGVRPGKPGAGARLHLIETLRAAAPWQKLRRHDGDRPGVRVRADDFRIRRFAEKSESTLIFVVDASGSAAAERLAETKGAVELLLAQAYVKRTQVALAAFRGGRAEIVLPPTRSLVRAKKCLADMIGGGGTPLASGIEAGQALAEDARGRGRTPFVILMTDGRANVSRDGEGGRAQAETDAQVAARRFGLSGIKGVVIDIASRPRDDARTLAQAMGAQYAALPRVDARVMRDVVGTLIQ